MATGCNARPSGPLPEEIELARFQARLRDLEDELVERELECATLRRELHVFRAHYLVVVGRRIAELDKLEAEIAVNFARHDPSPRAQREMHEALARAEASREALGEDPGSSSAQADEQERVTSPELKRLFRQVAKAMHPDLASDEDERRLRERFMAKANRAYERGDLEGLQGVLNEWNTLPETVVGLDIGAALVRAIRAIAAVNARLAEITAEMTVLGAEDLFALFDQARRARDNGRDLLRDMAEELEQRIMGARERLAGLPGESAGD